MDALSIASAACQFAKWALAKLNLKLLGLRTLRKEVQRSSFDVQRYLNLGWIGVCEMLDEFSWDMVDLVDLWQTFRSLLLQLQHLLANLERQLALWEKVFYLILSYFMFSEFPNRLRPPCTTMPWTIWPALVVLWGVCWMFYGEPMWNLGDQDHFSDASNTAEMRGGIYSSDLSLDLDFDVHGVGYNAYMWGVPHFDLPNLEQQPQHSVPEHATTFGISTTITSLRTPPEVVDALNPPVTNYGNPGGFITAPGFTSYRAPSTITKAADNEQLQMTQPGAPVPLNTPSPYRQAQDSQTVSSRNSKHGQTEKHFCTYADCRRSRQGSGFYRKDNLDQHLRGVHKQNSVPRLRVKPPAVSNLHIPMATGKSTGALLQSKKRKHGSEGETRRHNADGVSDELVEERRLRILAEQENHRLRQKLDNYEGRMQKYEERLDRMMTLLEDHKEVGKK